MVAHDAGGAEVISSWVKSQTIQQFAFLLQGPAERIFLERCGVKSLSPRERSILDLKHFRQVLTGTSWASDLEKRFIRLALKASVPVATYLDHWTDYSGRFISSGQSVLPNEIWVGDRHAERIARHTFPGTFVRYEPNLYFKEILDQITQLQTIRPQGKGIRILFATEPTSAVAKKRTGNPMGFGYAETEALEGYFEYLMKQATLLDTIRLRLHPSEPQGKYDGLIRKYQNHLPIEVGSGSSLAIDCGWADWVVGCDSMVMAIGVLAKKKVFCAIPPGGKPPSLPFSEIIQLSAVTNRRNEEVA